MSTINATAARMKNPAVKLAANVVSTKPDPLVKLVRRFDAGIRAMAKAAKAFKGGVVLDQSHPAYPTHPPSIAAWEADEIAFQAAESASRALAKGLKGRRSFTHNGFKYCDEGLELGCQGEYRDADGIMFADSRIVRTPV